MCASLFSSSATFTHSVRGVRLCPDSLLWYHTLPRHSSATFLWWMILRREIVLMCVIRYL